MNTMFTIGEFSKISGLPIDTLRYYDKIGLLSPEYINPSSKYRFYGVNQLVKSEIIKFNSDVGMKLEDMKVLFAKNDSEAVKNILESQKNSLKNQVLKMCNAIQRVENIQKAFINYNSLPKEGIIYTKQIPQRKIAYIDNACYDNNDENWYINIYKELLSKLQSQNIDIKYAGGFLLSYSNNAFEKATVFEEVDEIEERDGLKTMYLPKGLYMCINYYESNHTQNEAKLLERLKSHGATPRLMVKNYVLTGNFEYLERRFELHCQIDSNFKQTD